MITDAIVYTWNDPLLFRRGVDQIIKRYVLEDEEGEIIDKLHASYGGQFAGDRTAQKILQLGFYWPTLFRDCSKWAKHYDKC